MSLGQFHMIPVKTFRFKTIWKSSKNHGCSCIFCCFYSFFYHGFIRIATLIASHCEDSVRQIIYWLAQFLGINMTGACALITYILRHCSNYSNHRPGKYYSWRQKYFKTDSCRKNRQSKKLLRYSDKSLSAISTHLGFSSQSHFSRVFKSILPKIPAITDIKLIFVQTDLFFTILISVIALLKLFP